MVFLRLWLARKRRAAFEKARAASTPVAMHANARKTHCPAGHPYSPDNTYFCAAPGGDPQWRKCRTCRREQDRLRDRQRTVA
jgi:hypothetical protein